MTSNTQDNMRSHENGTGPYLGQDTGIGSKIARSAEQAYSKVTGRAGDTNTTNSRTDNQYGRPNDGYPPRDNRSQDVTGVEPSLKDKIVGKAERALGGNTTKGLGTDNQYGRSDDGYSRDGNRSQGVTGVEPSLKDKIVGKAERALGGNTTKGLGTDNLNQYERSDDGYTRGGNRNQEVTGVEPSLKDKIVGKAERAFGGNTKTGLGTDNQYGRPEGNRGQEVTGVQPSLKDRVVGKAERAFGGNTTTGSGTDNQYTTNRGPDQSYKARDTGVKPNLKDQIVGKAEQAYGKAEQFVDNLKNKI